MSYHLIAYLFHTLIVEAPGARPVLPGCRDHVLEGRGTSEGTGVAWSDSIAVGAHQRARKAQGEDEQAEHAGDGVRHGPGGAVCQRSRHIRCRTFRWIASYVFCAAFVGGHRVFGKRERECARQARFKLRRPTQRALERCTRCKTLVNVCTFDRALLLGDRGGRSYTCARCGRKAEKRFHPRISPSPFTAPLHFPFRF